MTFYYPKKHTLMVAEPKEKKKKPKAKSKKVEYGCEKCGLNKTAKHPYFEPYGNLESNLMIIANTPDAESDKTGIPFQSEQSVNLIRNNFRKRGLDIKRNAVSYFSVACRYKKKSDVYARCCRGRLSDTIKQIRPTVIITLGEEATNSVLGIKEAGMDKQSANKLRNRLIPSHEFNALVYPTFGVDNIVEFVKNDDGTFRYKTNYANKDTLGRDLDRIIGLFKKRYHKVTEVRQLIRNRNIFEDITITQIKTIRELNTVLKRLRENKKFAFDYESTNTKPHDHYYDVYYAGFGLAKEAWVIHTKDFDDIERAKILIKEILQDESILKYIQNKKFEELSSRWWMKARGEVIVKNGFCTMLATHIVDERTGCTSQDFQNLVRFGILPYGKEAYKYLHIKNKDDKVNKIHLAPVDMMVDYNGKDVISCYHNGETLRNTLIPSVEDYQWCYDLLYNGSESFCDVEEVGFNIDQDQLDSIESELQEKSDKLIEGIINLFKVKRYFKRTITVDGFKSFLRSPKQFQDYLYNYCKLTPVKKSASGESYSVDEEVISHHAERDKEPLCMQLTTFRKLEKAKGTYIDDIRRNINEDGRIHASINLHTVETYRSSITDPALQTLPVHGDIIEGIPWKRVREVFIPTISRKLNKEYNDYILAQVDYSGFELVVGAGISRDKKFIHDVNTTDLHAREAVRVFDLTCDPSKVKGSVFTFDGREFLGKDIRFETKNNCVFATVYGSVPNSCAKSLRNTEVFMAFARDKHKELAPNEDFHKWVVPWSEEHLKHWQQDQFFADYQGLKEYQENEMELFKSRGYVRLPMGFRRHHPLDRNKIINTPTQGTAFLTLLSACINVNLKIREWIERYKFISRIILETHDDMTFDSYKPELAELLEMVDEITLNAPKDEHFEFAEGLVFKNEWSFGYRLSDKKDINMIMEN